MFKDKNFSNIDNLNVETVISSIGEALIIIDRDYKIMLLNPKALELLEYKKDEILGKDLHSVCKILKNKKELSINDWPVEKVFSTNETIITSLVDNYSIMTDKQKNYLPVTFSISPLNNKSKNDLNNGGVIIIIRDANKDRELDRAKSGFISIASHQLRTPLTSIRWCSEMLLSGNSGLLNQSQRDLSQEIYDATSRINETVNLLLGISRIESGKITREKMSIDLAKVTAEVIKELSPIILGKKLVFFSLPTQIDPIVIMLDPVLLRQVILNLFSNSIHYTNENGTVEGSWFIDKEKNEVIYSVKDNGIGIPLDSQSRIFSKFFRASNAMLKIADGTGLGLAFVKDIVTSWGGRVYFETEEGKGSTFFFTMPMAKN